MKYLLKPYLLVMLLPSVLFGQVERPNSHLPNFHGHHLHIESVSDSDINIEALSASYFYQNPNIEIKLSKSKVSLGGVHRSYKLIYKGYPIEPVTISVHENIDGSVDIDYPEIPLEEADFTAPQESVFILRHSLKANISENIGYVWIISNNKLEKVRKSIHKGVNGICYHVLDNASKQIVLNQQQHSKDTTAYGMVFYPDPITSAHTFYAPPYIDSADFDTPELNAERVLKSFPVIYEDNLFKLENSSVILKDFAHPFLGIPTSGDGQFNYTRADTNFESVNAFFHINNFKSQILALNYNLPNFQVIVDPHASNSDYSFYLPWSKEVYLGKGGVDDAEDADVIVHEFGHAIIDAANMDNDNYTKERTSLNEAICDYFAASYTKDIDDWGKEKVFNWDGNNPPWIGRSATSTKDYEQADVANTNDIYEHTDIVVSCLMELDNVVGYENTMKIVLETLYRLKSWNSYRDFAYTMLESDRYLNGGVNYNAIVVAFRRRNVLPETVSIIENGVTSEKIELELYSTLDFAKGGAALLKSTHSILEYALISIDGKTNCQAETVNTRELKISSSQLDSGVYLLLVRLQNGFEKQFKLIRF